MYLLEWVQLVLIVKNIPIITNYPRGAKRVGGSHLKLSSELRQYKLRYIVGSGFVEMVISTNQKPFFYYVTQGFLRALLMSDTFLLIQNYVSVV